MNSEDYPFHYEIRFRLLAFDNQNNATNQSFVKVFKNKAPLENRKSAFEEFDEYTSFIKKVGRLKKNDKGNLWIDQPMFVNEILKQNIESDISTFLEALKLYKEEITVFLVITEDKIAREITQSMDFEEELRREYAIHKVTSSQYAFHAQDLIDNLDMVEVPIFEHFNIKIEDLVETVFHYGVDYAESGEDEGSGAKRRILSTPFVWDSYEDYNSNEIANEKEEKSNNINLEWKDIINKGESNCIEFKPCLIYNFKTNAAGIGVKYIIAKAICGFLNSNGGVVFIGVTDDGGIQGLNDFDYSLFEGKNGQDKILLELDSLISYFFNLSIKPLINSSIEKIEGKDILVIGVTGCSKPVFLRNKRYDEIKKEFYIRMNASTRQITDIEEIVEYMTNKENPAGNI